MRARNTVRISVATRGLGGLSVESATAPRTGAPRTGAPRTGAPRTGAPRTGAPWTDGRSGVLGRANVGCGAFLRVNATAVAGLCLFGAAVACSPASSIRRTETAKQLRPIEVRVQESHDSATAPELALEVATDEPHADDPNSCLDPAPPLLSEDGQFASDTRAGLSRGAIRSTIESSHDRFIPCYQQGLARNPELAGRMKIGFAITADGRVGYASLSENTFPDCSFTQCVLDQFSQIRFPAPGDGMLAAVYPLSFSTR